MLPTNLHRNSKNLCDHIRFIYFWSCSQTTIYGCSTTLGRARLANKQRSRVLVYMSHDQIHRTFFPNSRYYSIGFCQCKGPKNPLFSDLFKKPRSLPKVAKSRTSCLLCIYTWSTEVLLQLKHVRTSKLQLLYFQLSYSHCSLKVPYWVSGSAGVSRPYSTYVQNMVAVIQVQVSCGKRSQTSSDPLVSWPLFTVGKKGVVNFPFLENTMKEGSSELLQHFDNKDRACMVDYHPWIGSNDGNNTNN